MRFDLTYAAFRAFERASFERLPLIDSTAITAAKLLIALFKEEDCRAAIWLQDAGLSLAQFRHEFDFDTLEKSMQQPNYWTNNHNNYNNNYNNIDNADDNNLDKIDNGNLNNTDNLDGNNIDKIDSGNLNNTDNLDGNNIVQLHTPVSAPSFQVGNYGIPAEAYSAVASAASNSNFIRAVGVTNNSNSATNIAVPADPDGGGSSNQYSPKKRNPQQTPDELTLNENNPPPFSSKRYYSLFTANSDNSAASNIHGNQLTNKRSNWFYVDDQPVTIAQLSPELESAIETVSQQCQALNRKNQKIPISDGGVRTIETSGDKYSQTQPLATEHLLLAISMDLSDVGNWLSDHGLGSTVLRERIAALNNRNNFHNNQFDSQFITPKNNPNKKTQPQTNFTNDDADDEQLSYKIYRLLDAAANRGNEAVRVLEDYARFVIDNQNLTQKLKNFRHAMQTVLSQVDFTKRIAARATENDIGRELEAENEYFRTSPQNVIDVNFSRLQESLRSFEEFSKINYAEISKQVEQLRYQSYILHKDFLTENIRNENYAAELILDDDNSQLDNSQNNLRLDDSKIDDFKDNDLQVEDFAGSNLRVNDFQNDSQVADFRVDDISGGNLWDGVKADRVLFDLICGARFYVLVDCMSSGDIFREVVKGIIEGGADAIQLRDKFATDRVILNRGYILRELIDGGFGNVLFLMNDRVDLAKLVGADGVHVGQDDLPVAAARNILGDGFLVGVSTHNIEQARRAELDGADYIGVGPVFKSETKDFNLLAGVELIKEASLLGLKIPAFAIGGIDEENIMEVIKAGFGRVAVSNAVKNAPDPKLAAKKIKTLLQQYI
ncbi:MAG: thiamine phosphate synthase [Planctomycetaceae bacterium]|jgi:thiamine-phosphate diphosphorylase|nr:thiamine phosphate synthase [Planctomycetaceae bacterium]